MDQEKLTMQDPKDYIEIPEIGKRFGMSYDTALAWVKSMYFPSFKLGKSKFVIPRTAFEKFVSDPERIVDYYIKTYVVDGESKKPLGRAVEGGK